MGKIQPHRPVLLVLAAFSRHAAALDWARHRAEEHWGPVELESEAFDFVETNYYEPTMGPGLKKIFFAFERLISPDELPSIKHDTNRWEEEHAAEAAAEPRPLNLDPGYMTPAKLVLASTKDHAHRLYVARGIYAEITLHYHDRRWQVRDWTFPDYRRPDYHEFFDRCRRYLREKLRSEE